MTVGELQHKLDRYPVDDELLGWIAFEEVEPWGTRIEDNRFGVLGSIIANQNRKANDVADDPVLPDDLFPPYTEQERDALKIEKLKKLATKFSGKPT